MERFVSAYYYYRVHSSMKTDWYKIWGSLEPKADPRAREGRAKREQRERETTQTRLYIGNSDWDLSKLSNLLEPFSLSAGGQFTSFQIKERLLQ